MAYRNRVITEEAPRHAPAWSLPDSAEAQATARLLWGQGNKLRNRLNACEPHDTRSAVQAAIDYLLALKRLARSRAIDATTAGVYVHWLRDCTDVRFQVDAMQAVQRLAVDCDESPDRP